MARSHPAQFDDHGAPHLAQWARNTVASFTLLACLVSLSIILHTQYGLRLAGAIVHGLGAIDLTQLVNLADTPAKPVALDANAGKYRAVGDYLARRYRVSAEMTTSVVAKAYDIGAEMKVDPLLILAVI